jgi:hypothetical protein
MDTTATRTPERPREIFRIKNGHFYLIRFRSGQEDAVADAAARWAIDKRFDFNWSDAVEIGEKLR